MCACVSRSCAFVRMPGLLTCCMCVCQIMCVCAYARTVNLLHDVCAWLCQLCSNRYATTNATRCMCRVGQDHRYTVCIRYFWQGNHHIYGVYIRIYTVLANPMYVPSIAHILSVTA